MSHVSRAGEVAPSALESFGQAVIEMGGGAEYHADPRVLFAAARELARYLRQRVAGLAMVPPGAAGGFLQPPQGSHFGTES
jgi:hypothetical protein